MSIDPKARTLSFVLLLTVASCTGGGGAAAPASTAGEPSPSGGNTSTTLAATTTLATTTNTTGATTTTLTEPTTSAVEIPYPDTTGEDWVRILRELRSFVVYMLQNPDPELADAYAVPGLPPHQFYVEVLSSYVAEGTRGLPGAEGEVLEATLVDGSVDAGEVTIRLVWRDNGYTAVDEAGEVVEREEPTGDGVYSVVLHGSPESGWRLALWTYVGPHEGGA